MRRYFWPIIIAVLVFAVGGVLGIVGGALFLPLIGFLVMVGILVWLFARKAEHKPPME